MEDVGLLIDLVLALLAAAIGGMVAHRLRQPPILGYLLAGIAIGPFTPGPVGDIHEVQTVATIGVVLLMFALGVEFSLSTLRRVRAIALGGGSLYIGLLILLGLAIAPALGLDLVGGLWLGSALALSSTMVALKLLLTRGELGAPHGRAGVALLIAQDLAVVPMVVILSALDQPGSQLLPSLALALLKAVVVLVATYQLGTRLIPALLGRLAATGSRELFLIALVTLALGMALVTHVLGLSLALGAFLTGLVVSESEYAHQVLAEAVPFRDLFASLFFVGIGMLLDPRMLLSQAGLVLALAVVIVITKALVGTLIIMAFRQPLPTAVRTGLLLAQVGEFSFVLAALALQQQALPAGVQQQLLAAAVLSIAASPALLAAAPRLIDWLEHLPWLGPYLAARDVLPMLDPHATSLRRHVIICGYGRVGRELAEALRRRGLAQVIVDRDPRKVAAARAQGLPAIYGDATQPAVLQAAGLDKTRLLAVTIPDGLTAEQTVRTALGLRSDIEVAARGDGQETLGRLWAAGARALVQPEFEAGMAFVAHTLRRVGIDSREITALLAGRRRAYYDIDGTDAGYASAWE